MVYDDENFGKGEAPMFDGSRYVVNTGNEIRYTLRIMYFPRHNHYKPILNLNAVFGFTKNIRTIDITDVAQKREKFLT